MEKYYQIHNVQLSPIYGNFLRFNISEETINVCPNLFILYIATDNFFKPQQLPYQT